MRLFIFGILSGIKLREKGGRASPCQATPRTTGVIDEPLVNLRSSARDAVSQSLLYDFVLHLRVQLCSDLPISVSSSIPSLQQVKLMQKKFLYSDAFRLPTAFSSHLARRVFVRVSNTRAWGLFFPALPRPTRASHTHTSWTPVRVTRSRSPVKH